MIDLQWSVDLELCDRNIGDGTQKCWHENTT